MDPTAATAFDPADGVAGRSRARRPSAIPVATAIPVPPAAQSALRQAAILDARIADDANALSRIASNGDGQRHRKGPALALGGRRHRRRPRAAHRPVAGRRDAVQGPRRLLRGGHQFRARQPGRSITDTKAYRTNAKSMLKILKGLPALDAASRTLAAVAEVELPPVDLGALGSN